MSDALMLANRKTAALTDIEEILKASSVMLSMDRSELR